MLPEIVNMSPGLLFLLTLSLTAAVPTTNYDLIKTIVVNYMTAFEGSKFNSTDVCFNSATTSKLDGDVVALLKATVFGKVEDLGTLAKTLATDAEIALWNCQVEDIMAAFTYNVQVHGYKYILGNVFWRAPDIYKCALEALADGLILNFGGMATQLGTANKLVSPPKPTNARLAYPSFDSQTFLSGLLYGLESSPNSADQCVQGLSSLTPQVTKLETDLKSVLSGNLAAAFQLYADFKNLYSAAEDESSVCNIPALLTVLKSLTTAAGVNQFVANVKANWSAIEADGENILNCQEDAYQCGFSAGEVLRLTLNWSL